MAIAEKIWPYYYGADKTDAFVQSLACGEKSEYAQSVSLLESQEGYIADIRILPKAYTPWSREKWHQWIEECLLDVYEEAWIPELNLKHEQEFSYHALVGWTLYRPTPFKLTEGTLVLYPNDNSKVYE